MALPLHIPPCIRDPRHAHHPPPFDKPLRIQIEGPLVSIKRLVPDASWHLTRGDPVPAIQPAGHALARLTYRCLYGRDPDQDKASGADKCLVVRDEYLGWIHRKK